MSEYPFAACWSCVHRIEPASIEQAGTARCAAYPTAIPLDIISGAPHDTARGDERDGLVYEQATDDASAFWAEQWRAYRAALAA